eukprot:122240-Lingulodinium_polyedra.AAC.1
MTFSDRQGATETSHPASAVLTHQSLSWLRRAFDTRGLKAHALGSAVASTPQLTIGTLGNVDSHYC